MWKCHDYQLILISSFFVSIFWVKVADHLGIAHKVQCLKKKETFDYLVPDPPSPLRKETFEDLGRHWFYICIQMICHYTWSLYIWQMSFQSYTIYCCNLSWLFTFQETIICEPLSLLKPGSQWQEQCAYYQSINILYILILM